MVDITEFSARPSAIEGLWVITMKQVTDERGTVREFYRESAFEAAGIPSLGPFLQLNITESRHGAIRGLHGEAMSKLVAVVAGEAFGAYVDTRPGSPTFGVTETVELVAGAQVLVPQGVCNGFQTTTPTSQYLYGFDTEWVPGMAGTALTPLDPALGINWPVAPDPEDAMMVSAKDFAAPLLTDLPRE